MRKVVLNAFPGILFCTFIMCFFSCERITEEIDESKFGYDYFPLAEGRYWVYEADSTIYDDDGAKIIETISQVREEIIESYIDEVGDTIFIIERFWRSKELDPWTITDVWTGSMNSNQAFRTEENLKFIKFVFPPLEDKSWDGNIYFDNETILTVAGESIAMFSGWNDAYIQSLDQSEKVGNFDYDKVATVILTDDEYSNTIERRYALEKYARGVGLVYKEYEILDSQCITCDPDWQTKAEKGFILKQTLIEHN